MTDPKEIPPLPTASTAESTAEPESLQEYLGATASTDVPPKAARRPRYLPPLPEDKKKRKPVYSQAATPAPPSNEQILGQGEFVFTSLFSLSGRMGRLSSLAADFQLVLLMVLAYAALTVLMIFAGIGMSISHSMSGLMGLGAGFTLMLILPSFVMLFFIYVFQVRRLHDLNLSGWWIMISIAATIISIANTFIRIPGLDTVTTIINLIFMLGLIFAPGTAGVNRFGPPRFTSTGEKIWAWAYVVLIALSCLFMYPKYSEFKQMSAMSPTTLSAEDQAKLDAQSADLQRQIEKMQADLAKQAAADKAAQDQAANTAISAAPTPTTPSATQR